MDLEKENQSEDISMSLSSDIPSLSADDVTWPSSIPTPQAQKEVEQDSLNEIDVSDDSLLENKETSEDNTPPELLQNSEAPRNICQNPLVWPISIWASNSIEEVMALERFLIARGLLITSDGVFWNDDFEAIKQFQEEFRSEVLTPWGINNPTWYVGRTTIQKIQELACR